MSVRDLAGDPKPEVMVELMELTAAELERRAERQLKLSRDLLAQASLHATLIDLPHERSVGRYGIVTEAETIRVAKELGAFDRRQFAEALGLKPASVSRWLAKLLEREHPVIERRADGSYAYINPTPVTQLRSPAPSASKRERASRAASRQAQAGTGAALLRGVPRQARGIVRDAQRQGWVLSRQGNGHYQLTNKEGKTIGFGSTPTNADHTALAIQRDLERHSSH